LKILYTLQTWGEQQADEYGAVLNRALESLSRILELAIAGLNSAQATGASMRDGI